MDVRVNTMLSDVESAQLDLWVAGHALRVAAVEIHRDAVFVRSVDGSGEFARRTPGHLVAALDAALRSSGDAPLHLGPD
jgi:hypothetical protein